MVAIDFYLNETTRHADVILPPTTALERDHYDLVFHSLAIRNTARFSSAVFARPDGARHDWEIFRDLTLRLGEPIAAEGPAEGQIDPPWASVAEPDRHSSPCCSAAGRMVSLGQLRAHPEGVDLGPLRPAMPGATADEGPTGRSVPDLLVGDLDRLRRWLDDRPAEALVLIGRRHKQDNNSWFHNTTRLTRGKPRHHLLMHPGDLAARGIADGSLVSVASRVGSVRVEVAATDDIMPGVVSLPHGYGHQRRGPGCATPPRSQASRSTT